ncbi:hypothetical protein HpMS107_12570 [Helicobacter pylori]|jgi:hypothetical protein
MAKGAVAVSGDGMPWEAVGQGGKQTDINAGVDWPRKGLSGSVRDPPSALLNRARGPSIPR